MDEVKKATPRASEQDWKRAEEGESFSAIRCILDLRDRVAALEAAADTSAPAAAPAGGWSGVAVDCLPPIGPAVWVGTPADVAPQVVPTTSTVLTVDELADCLPANAWAGPEGYSRQAFARHLLDHPRIGPLLRGEGAGVSKRVVLPEEPPDRDSPTWMDDRQAYAWCCGRSAAWADFVTEVVRQQQGGQVEEALPSDGGHEEGGGWFGHPLRRYAPRATPAAAPAGGVTVGELEHILGRGLLATRGAARWLINHPRIGPLLRGEGAPAPKRVVLAERPPLPEHPTPGLTGGIYLNGYVDGWAAARAEVKRQQQGGQADG